ncbi:MAG: HU family DNA-binding protein [Lachnoclostridium sp.]|nr:HU family DNA-binding protein [Lachnoclostridium sp.]
MDYKQFISRLSTFNETTPAATTVLADRLVSLLKENASRLDTVAIPGFGSFVTEKTDEQVITDPSTGKRTLMPPAITMTFKPSILLRKKL